MLDQSVMAIEITLYGHIPSMATSPPQWPVLYGLLESLGLEWEPMDFSSQAFVSSCVSQTVLFFCGSCS